MSFLQEMLSEQQAVPTSQTKLCFAELDPEPCAAIPALVAAAVPEPEGASLGGTGAASQRSRREQAASFKQENLNSCPANHPLERELSDQRLLILECDFVSKKLSRLKQ